MENTSPASTYVLFYHANCTDGLMASAIAHSYLPDAHSVPINYDSHEVSPDDYVQRLATIVAKENSGLAFTPNMRVYFLDFCPKPDQIRAMLNSGYAVTIVDHHKSAYRDFCDTVGIDGFDDFNPRLSVDAPDLSCDGWKGFAVDGLAYLYCESDSGALMTYKLFQWMVLGLLTPDEATEEILTVPNYVKWVSDRDLWKFEYPETKVFDAGMSLYKQIQPGFLIRHIETTGVDTILAEGKAVLAANEAYVRSHVPRIKTVVTVTRVMFGTPTLVPFQKDGLEVVRIAMYNCTHLASELCAGYFESQNEVHVMIAYTIIGQDEVICQMRSRAGYPVNFIAEMFGGGGHENACAFTITMTELLHALETSDLIAPSPVTDS